MQGTKLAAGMGVIAIALVWGKLASAQQSASDQQDDPGFLSSLLSRIEAKAATVYLGGMREPASPPQAAAPAPPQPSAMVEARPVASPVVEFLSAGSAQSPRAIIRMPDGGRTVVLPGTVLGDGRRVVSITYDGGVVVEDQARRRTSLPFVTAPRAPHPMFPTMEGR